jgi:hypothetical protein
MWNGASILASIAICASVVGCGRYESGNLDRANCQKLRAGIGAPEVAAVMGQPRDTLVIAGGVLWLYNTPSMPGMPFFGQDRSVEVELVEGPSGLLLKEARCSGVDG